jgi:disulfide bond formation protein DsbB
MMQITNTEAHKAWWIIFCCWIIATIAMCGSLFFSEVMEFPPCVLCWYQRIAMYPLVIIFLVGSFQSVKSAFAFSWPFVSIGWLIALYHNLLHYEIIPESASPCLEGVSCSTVYINWFGFITIPILSFVSFSLIFALLMLLKKKDFYEK